MVVYKNRKQTRHWGENRDKEIRTQSQSLRKGRNNLVQNNTYIYVNSCTTKAPQSKQSI